VKFRTLMTWSYLKDSDELTQDGAVEEIYGYSKSDFQQNKNLWYEVIYPDDRKYLDLAVESLDVKNNQEIPVQYRIIHKDGYAKNVLGTIKVEERSGQTFYSGFIIDISIHKESMIAEDYRDNLLSILNDSIHKLYSVDENRVKRVCSLLEQLAELMSVGRVIVYKNISENSKRLQFENVFRWSEANLTNKGLINSSTKRIKFGEDFERWQHLFVNKREPVNNIVRLLPESEKSAFEQEGVKSILAVPIWLNSDFHGFIRFDDFKLERYWTRENIRVLSLIGALIASSGKYVKSKEMIRSKVEQLKKMQEEKEQFLKMLSHQFKTPLSIIELNIRMLERVEKQLDGDAGKKYRKKVDRILRAVENTKELIEAILIGESYKTVDGVPEKIHILKTVQKHAVSLRSDHEGEVEIIDDIKRDSPVITLPFGRKTFEYILDAVLSNSAKYSGEDVPKVEVEVTDKDNFLVLSVKDRGIGIHEEDLKNIGTTFFRGGNVGDIPSSGIGLAMVKAAVEEVYGSFEIKSKLGEFTKVTIKLPLADPSRQSE